MKILLVTSEVTYIPDNYLPLFKELFNRRPELFKGLVILRNLDKKTLKSVLGLKFLGANKVFKTLIKNIFRLPLKEKQKLANSKGIETFLLESMNSKEAIEITKNLDIDLIINLRTRCIYKAEILNTPKLGCLNIHHGILPIYRGTMCDLYALSESRPAGFTIHQMNTKIDAGKILRVKEVSDGSDKDYINYLTKTSLVEAQELLDLIDEIIRLQKLPEGILNQSEKIIFTKNPTRKKIKQFINEGLVL